MLSNFQAANLLVIKLHFNSTNMIFLLVTVESSWEEIWLKPIIISIAFRSVCCFGFCS